MGVDVSMQDEALGRCREAKCRGYRRGVDLPVLILLKRQIQRHIIPLGCLPFDVETSKGIIQKSTQVDEAHFAVAIQVTERKMHRKCYRFLSWVSKQEYNFTLQFVKQGAGIISANKTPFPYPFSYWDSPYSPYNFRQRICQFCPLSLDYDCEPRLFGYSSLPALRHVVKILSEHPLTYSEARKLIDELSQIFTTGTNSFNENPSEKSEKSYRKVVDSLIEQGFNRPVVGDIRPENRNERSNLADRMLNYLFFRGSNDINDLWVGGEQLKSLDMWIDNFLRLIENILDVTHEDMRILYDVLNTLKKVSQLSVQNDLSFTVSW